MSANDSLALLRQWIFARQVRIRQKQQQRLQREDRLIRRRKHQQILGDRWRQYQLRRYFGLQLLEFYQRRYEIEAKRRSERPKPQRKTVRFASFNHVTQMPSDAADPLPPSITRDMGVPISVQEMEDNDDEYTPEVYYDDDEDDDMDLDSTVDEEARMLNAALDARNVACPDKITNGLRGSTDEGKSKEVHLPLFLDMEGLLRQYHPGVIGGLAGDEPVLDDRPKYGHSSKRKSRGTKGKFGTFDFKSYDTTNFDPPPPVDQSWDLGILNESNSINSTDSRSITPKIHNGVPSLPEVKRMSSEKKRKKSESELDTATGLSVPKQETSNEDDEMTDIFCRLKERMHTSKLADGCHMKSGPPNGRRSRRDVRGPNVTEEGWKVYSMDELKSNQPPNLSGPCPFDCSCCFI